MTPRTYELYLPATFKVFLVFFGVMSVVVPVIVVVLARQPNGLPLPIAGLFTAVIGFVWLYLLRFPHRIVVSEDERLEFVAVLRRRTLAAADVVAVRPYGSQPGYLVFNTSGRGMVIMNRKR